MYLHLPFPHQVSDWLDYVVGKSGLPPNFMKREKPAEKKKLRKRRVAAGGSTEEEPDAPEPSGRGRVRTHCTRVNAINQRWGL